MSVSILSMANLTNSSWLQIEMLVSSSIMPSAYVGG
jgi:hypothetical protein